MPGQTATPPGKFTRRLRLAVGPELPDELAEQSDGSARTQRLHREPQVGVEAGQTLAAHDHDPTARSGRQQRTHLLGTVCIVHDQQQPQATGGGAPCCDEVCQAVRRLTVVVEVARFARAGRERVVLAADHPQHSAQGPLGGDAFVGGAVCVQVDEEAAVGVGVDQCPGGTHHQGGLADACCTVDGHHGHGVR